MTTYTNTESRTASEVSAESTSEVRHCGPIGQDLVINGQRPFCNRSISMEGQRASRNDSDSVNHGGQRHDRFDERNQTRCPAEKAHFCLFGSEPAESGPCSIPVPAGPIRRKLERFHGCTRSDLHPIGAGLVPLPFDCQQFRWCLEHRRNRHRTRNLAVLLASLAVSSERRFDPGPRSAGALSFEASSPDGAAQSEIRGAFG